MLTGLTSEQVLDLNRSDVANDRAQLGTRLQEGEAFGVLAYSYATAHADKTYVATDLPSTPIVRITLTAADAAANLILPAEVNKLYVIVNTSGQAITVKVAGQTGIVVASTKKAILVSSGTDFIRITADA